MRRKSDDFIVAQAFVKIIGAREWPYDQPPSFYYNEWEDYINGKTRLFFWDMPRKYKGYREVDMFNSKWIHDVFEKTVNARPTQLLINLEI